MNHLKPSVTGVDAPIQRIQRYLYDSLDTGNFDGYGRIYKIERNGIDLPCWYISDREYKEVSLSDKVDGSFFFNIGDSQGFDINSNVTTDCEILFTFNLGTIKGSDVRSDEEVLQDVIYYLQRFKGIFNITEVVRGLDSVYSDFSGVSKYFKNLQPYFHFKVKGKLLYNINIKCTN